MSSPSSHADVRRDFLKRAWDGRLPVKISLSKDSSALADSDEKPALIHIMARRNSYLCMLCAEVEAHFKDVIVDHGTEAGVWFTCRNESLHWHYPIGVLYDMTALSSTTETTLPWTLEVHFGTYPVDKILRSPSLDALRAIYTNVFKEACYMKWGSTSMLTQLPLQEQRKLWDSITKDDFEAFYAVFTQIEETGGTSLLNIPFRLYRKDVPFLQEPIRFQREDGTPTTVLDVLEAGLRAQDGGIFKESDSRGDRGRVVIHGIEVALDTPLSWLVRHFTYADQFLHFCWAPGD